MPIYEYEQTCCSSQFELTQSFNDNNEVACPRCGGKTQRIFSPVPIIFKGSGFYVTDSRGGNNHVLGEGSVDKSKTSSTALAKTSNAGEAKTGSTDEAKASNTEKAKANNTEKGS